MVDIVEDAPATQDAAPGGAVDVGGRRATLRLVAHGVRDGGAVLASDPDAIAWLGALHVGRLDDVRAVEDVAAAVADLGVAGYHAGVPAVGGCLVVDDVYRGTSLAHTLVVGLASTDAEGDAVAAGPAEGRPALGTAAARPAWIDEVTADAAERLPRAASGDELAAHVLRVAGSAAVADRSALTDRLDRYARGHTVLAAPEDAGVVRLAEGDGRGVAVSLDSNPRFALLNPYLGAQLALGEAHRNVAATGARPVASVAALAGGDPDDPAVGWQLDEMLLGLDEGCAALRTPPTGVGAAAHPAVEGRTIHPTPVVGVLGVVEDVTDLTPMGFVHPGDAVVLLGETREELSGSVWADVVHGHLGGMPPAPELDAERALAGVLADAARRRLLTSAHALSGGGLAQALVESALRHDRGVALTLPAGDPTVQLFAESAARVLVSVSGQHHGELVALCRAAGVPLERLGEVIEEPVLEVQRQFTLGLTEVRAAWAAPLRAVWEG